jgi:glycosyltransferase involved in cell wall biosynthesis
MTRPDLETASIDFMEKASRMNILFLTQIIPYPPDAGPKVKTWHVLRYLNGLGHRVFLAAFMRPEEEPFVPALREVCAEVHTVPIRRSRLDDIGFWLRSHLTGRPFLIERDDLAAMRGLVARLLARESIDLIHADQLTMTQFAFSPGAPIHPQGGLAKPGETNIRGQAVVGPRRIFDAHNAVWTIVERMRQNAPAPLRPVAALEARRIKRYEGMIIHTFDHTLAVTEPDRQSLFKAAAAYSADRAVPGTQITVVPIAVDTAAQAPVSRRPGSLNIFTLGTLHYPPNADGIRWFLQEVFPLVQAQVPGSSLTIVGKNPPQDFLNAASLHPESVQVTGYVPDLEPYIEQAAMMVVPVRAGGGMRVRILEGFARGIPVVTTTVGLEGIDAQVGEEVLVADTPAEFAREVIRLFHDQGLQDRLSSNGRRLAEACYDWQVVLKQMDGIYRDEKVFKTHYQ